jgi:elongation factor P
MPPLYAATLAGSRPFLNQLKVFFDFFPDLKSSGFAQVKVDKNTFSAGHKIEEVRVETRKYQYLYAEGDTYHFMNTDDYNQISLQKEALDSPELLKEGEIVTIIIRTSDEMPLAVEMPVHVFLEVTHTEPGVKGNTATNATKPATVETGAKVNVPLFINEGDKIKIDTEKGAYLERVKD